MKIERNRHIALSDGVRLKADVYRPDGEEPVPALVGWSAFGKEVQAVGRGRKPLKLGQCMDDLSIEISGIDFWVEHGYAVVLVNPRGISTSEGVWRGLYSEQDQKDCAAAVEWAAWQDWCSRKVGMLGCGTAGRIQPMVAALQPPHLKAIMPIDLVDDLYAECYPGGTLSNYYLPFTSTIPMINAMSDAEAEMDWETLLAAMKESLEDPAVQSDPYLYRTMDTVPPRHFPWLVDIILHNKPGEFWEKRSTQNKLKDIKIPMYCATLRYEFGRSTFGAIQAFLDPGCTAPRKLMLLGHPVDRHTPFEEPNGEMLRWYDHWLKGVENGIMDEPPVKLYVTGENKVRTEETFPPKGMHFESLYFQGEGKLSFQGPKGEAPEELYHEPPIYKSQFSRNLPAVKYATQPMEEDMELSGPVSVTLYSAVDQDDAIFVVKLWDHRPDGARLLLSDGYLKASLRGLTAQSKPGEPVHDVFHPLEVAQGEIYEYVIGMNPVCHVFKAGHRLEVELKACDAESYSFTDFVTIPRLFSSGLTSGVLPSTKFTRFQFYHDAAHPAHLLLPIVPAAPADRWTDWSGGEAHG